MSLPPHLQALESLYEQACSAYQAEPTEENRGDYLRRFDEFCAALRVNIAEGLTDLIVAEVVGLRVDVMRDIQGVVDRVRSRLRAAQQEGQDGLPPAAPPLGSRP